MSCEGNSVLEKLIYLRTKEQARLSKNCAIMFDNFVNYSFLHLDVPLLNLKIFVRSFSR